MSAPTYAILPGDLRAVLPALPEASIGALVTDPPYELGFMGKGWDASGVAFDPATWRACLRVMRPGAYGVAFGGTRTYHRLTCAIEDAGFEIRDCLSWLYGTGFPKSLQGPWGGTALKPAWEPIVLFRRPPAGTIAATYEAYGTGGLGIETCRENKRWPANVLLDEEAAAALDAQSGTLTSGKSTGYEGPIVYSVALGAKRSRHNLATIHGDSGGASRFFYTAKASTAERERGCEHLPKRSAGELTEREDGTDGLKSPRAGAGRASAGRANHHPTVKPIALMRWLVKLVAPPGQIVLDPFCGSGSTGCAAVAEGREFLGVELTPEYLPIALARIAACDS